MSELDARNKIDGKQIVMYIDDVKVEGEFVRRERHDMTVKITSPYSGLTNRTGHIMVIARGVIHWEGERGDKRAYELLSSMYYLMSGIDGQEQKLRLYMDSYKKEKEARLSPTSPEMLKIENLMNERKSYKAQMRAGEITSTKYGQLIQPINKEIKSIEFDLDCHLQEFFDDTFAEFLNRNGSRIHRDSFITALKLQGVFTSEELEF